MHTLKTIESYILSGRIIWHVISIYEAAISPAWLHTPLIPDAQEAEV
jgi:hypothetical protein